MFSLKIKTVLIVLAVCFLPVNFARAADAGFTGQTNANGINVRVDATVGAEVICTLAKGEVVEVVKEAYDWYKIRLPKEAPSYIRKDLLECNNSSRNNLNPDFTAQPGKCLSAKVVKERVNIRLGPSESSWILGKIDKDTVVNIISESGSWYKIHPVYQSYGWINKKFVNKEVVPLPKPEPSAKEAAAAGPGGQLIIEGKVSPYGIVLWRKATHKLLTAENKIYYLKGDRQTLDSLNYRKVRITGKIIGQAENNSPIIQIDIIEALN
jgi:uncharacterized protein YgiM (DUF1202 family)